MIDYLATVITAVLVLWLIQRFNLVNLGKEVLATARQANAIAADKTLTDLEQETQTQQAATKLLGQFVKILTASAGAFLLPLLPLYGLSFIDVINLDNVLAIMVSIEFIVVFSLVAILSIVKLNRG